MATKKGKTAHNIYTEAAQKAREKLAGEVYDLLVQKHTPEQRKNLPSKQSFVKQNVYGTKWSRPTTTEELEIAKEEELLALGKSKPVTQRSQKSRSTDVAKVSGKAAAQKTGAKVQSQRAAPKSATTYTVKEGRNSKTFATKGEAETCARQAKNRNVTITKGTKQPTHRIVNFTAKK